MNPWILLAVLVLIALAAPRYGVDSRWPPPGEMRPPRRGPTPRSDLAALARSVRRRFGRSATPTPSTPLRETGAVG
ncbi:hypothetical protein [Pseudonocardia humida]|uniref:Uncharacterized protein n=1 Tax=Pseudonocardia humida TaxID=2800819 RepID=A0ABT0ZZU6_9PSEU|nr:hypothetical protein [Pseudonocardia humida]MCO1656089.1 hypothetical protein [Pseudonocardia humida]